jgi:uroporphyrinogen III methyltransferase/synthase
MNDSPLLRVRVAVTRPLSTTGEDPLVSLLRAAGAIPLHLPLIRILPPQDPAPLLSAVQAISGYDWIVLTSPRSVEPFASALQDAGVSPEQLAALGVRICAVGPATAEALNLAGFAVDLLPRRFDAEGVVEVMREAMGPAEGGRVLLPRAEEGREVIPRELAASGLRVDVVSAYRTVPVEEEAARLVGLVRDGAVDVIAFTSGSAVRAFAAAWSADRPPEVGMVSMGPSSTTALNALGFPVHGEARVHTLAGLVAALEAWEQVRRFGATTD